MSFNLKNLNWLARPPKLKIVRILFGTGHFLGADKAGGSDIIHDKAGGILQ